MTPKLILKDIVRRAELNRRTARYVLEHDDQLGISQAAGQGYHRIFPLEEAIQLAVCARLVMMGVPLVNAIAITSWSKKRFKALSCMDDPAPEYVYETRLGNPWKLHLINGKCVRINRSSPQGNELNFDTGDEYFDIETGKKILVFDIALHLPITTWSLTHLAFELARPA